MEHWTRRLYIIPFLEGRRVPKVVTAELTDTERWKNLSTAELFRQPLVCVKASGEWRWEWIAGLVNPKERWRSLKLKEAWESLLRLWKIIEAPVLPNDLVVAEDYRLPDNDTTDSFQRPGISFWWLVTQKHGVAVPEDISAERLMMVGYRCLHPLTLTRATLLQELEYMDKGELLSLLATLAKARMEEKKSLEHRPEEPLSSVQAVICAAVKWKVNIANAKDPLLTYQSLHESRKHWPDLQVQYDPRIPIHCYDKSSLRTFLTWDEKKIADENDLASYQRALEPHPYEPIFMLGWWGDCTETLIYRTPKHSARRVISYGIHPAVGGGADIIVMTAEEWEECWENYGYICSPSTRLPIPQFAINRLRRQAKSFILLVGQSIMRTLTKVLDTAPEAINLRELPGLSSELDRIRDITMSMRGWVPGNPYPISTLVHGSEESHRRVLEGLTLLYEDLTPTTARILSLPLVMFREGEYTVPEKGSTLGSRLELVRRGESGDVRSCIRTSSNWILSTLHKAYKDSGLEPGYDIREMITIA